MYLIPENTNHQTPGISKKPTAQATDDTLRHQAFNNSFQANIITLPAGSGKILVVNKTACKLLGYSKRELLTKKKADIFDINESSFKKMYKQREVEGHSKAYVTVIKKSGRRFLCEVTSAFFIGEHGIKKAIVTITDMSQIILKQKKVDTKKEKIVADNIALAKSKQKVIDTGKEKIIADNIILAQTKSDSRQAENNKWIKIIAKTSYNVMWDWNVATGKIYVSDSIKELLGHKVQNNTLKFTDFVLCLLPEEKNTIEKKLLKIFSSGKKSWNDSFTVKRDNGSVAFTTCRATIVRDEKGKVIRLIGAIQDISRLRELKNELEDQVIIKKELNEIFRLAAKLSVDVIWDWNLLTNEMFIGDGFEELFGYPIKNNKGNLVDWSNHIHPDDKETVEKGFYDAIASSVTLWENTYRLLRTDGSVARVFGRAGIIRHADGKAYRMIGVIQDLSRQKELEEKLDHDISDLKVLEERLEGEIKLKKKQIAEATEEAKENERSDIGKELHDNVNQLLGISRLCLDMAKQGGENREMYLNRSSQYTLKAIEEIRKLTKGLTTDVIKDLGLCEAIDNITRGTMEVNPLKISCILDSFIENRVNNKFKLNVFRMVQEQLNNILKHAKATKVIISLTQNKKFVILTISDNGIGFDTTKKQKGIGIANIKSRAASYNGTAEFISQPLQGCVLNVTFPVTDALLDKR